MNGKLFWAISLGILVGGGCLYLFIRWHEEQVKARQIPPEAPPRPIGFGAIMATMPQA
jgi:hypothetical protein